MHKFEYWVDKPNRYQTVSAVHAILWILLVILIYQKVMLPALNAGKSYGITDNSVETIIIDFPSHFNFAKEVWLSSADRSSSISAYSVENQLHFTSKWAGSDVSHSLSFGYSPTMIWLLAPLHSFSHAVAFCIFNLAGLLSVWWQTRPIRCRLGIGLLSFISPLFYACMSLGQTALITGACLLYISENTENKPEKLLIKRVLYTATALWVLTAKPPLALVAGAVLVTLRKWQPVMIALILTLVMTFTISPLLGADWTNDYITLISRHNIVEADKAFAWSHAPAHMANLRGILNVDFKIADNIASRISAFFWILSLVWMMTLGARLRLHQNFYWALGIIFYLLFCPHVSSTEEMQLVLLIPLCTPAMKKNLNFREFVLFALLLFTPFISPAVGPFFLGSRWGLFTAKIFLLILIVYNFIGYRGQEE